MERYVDALSVSARQFFHFWITAASCLALCGLFLLWMFRSGGFDHPLANRQDETVTIRPAPPEPDPVVVIVNNAPDESDCQEILIDANTRPIVDQVVSIRKLRELPVEENLTFSEQMDRWRERENYRISLIQKIQTDTIPYEPSPEEIIRSRKIQGQNEIQERVSRELAEAEFDVIDRQQLERKARHHKAMEEEKRLREYKRQLSGLGKGE